MFGFNRLEKQTFFLDIQFIQIWPQQSYWSNAQDWLVPWLLTGWNCGSLFYIQGSSAVVTKLRTILLKCMYAT